MSETNAAIAAFNARARRLNVGERQPGFILVPDQRITADEAAAIMSRWAAAFGEPLMILPAGWKLEKLPS